MKTTTLLTATATAILAGGASLGAQSDDTSTGLPELEEKAPLVQPITKNDASENGSEKAPPACSKCPVPTVENAASIEKASLLSRVDTKDRVIVIVINGQDFIVDEQTRASFNGPARCDFDFAPDCAGPVW